MQQTLFLLILMGQCFFITSHLYKYYLIKQKKTWAEAQSYCKDKYTDLATVSDMTDNERLSDIMKKQEAWIGLSSNEGYDNRTWHWSLPGVSGEVLSTLKPHFAEGQPNDRNEIENCVFIRDEEFHDAPCNEGHKFACIHETKPPDERIVLIDECLNWTQAQNYCREHHTDLFSGLDQLDLLKNKTLNFKDSKCEDKNRFWIGLFRDTWSWSDGNISSFRRWDQGLLKDGVDKKECATVLNSEGKWSSANCTDRKHFVCYDEETVNSELLATQQPEGDLPPTDPRQEETVNSELLATQQPEGDLPPTDPRQDKVILVKEKKTWKEASDYCRENHDDLVTITNDIEQRWVQHEAKNAQTSHVWLGLRYTCTFDFWFWVSDYVVNYKNWAPGHENDGCACDRAGAMEKGGDYKWFKKKDEEELNFICSKA